MSGVVADAFHGWADMKTHENHVLEGHGEVPIRKESPLYKKRGKNKIGLEKSRETPTICIAR
jgi:hypothetical protein